MKPPHGSRDGLASRARRCAGDGGDPEERDEGPELGAMRSVWLAMRDEDPPERGLAELLAAAGAKAATMQAGPTWWQRLAAGLRRPPALALVTVLVLVAGAVFVGRRGVEAPVPVRVPDPTDIEPAAGAPAGAHRAVDAAPVVTAVEGAGDLTRNTEAPPVPAGHVALRREPTRKAPSREPPAPEAVREAAALTSGDLAGKKATKEAKDDEATTAEHDKQRASPVASIEPLYEQCESAARRGDCGAVRRLISRITTRDRGYRARIAKDSAIGKCLPETAE